MTEPKEEKCEACCGSGYINFWTDDGHISMRTCRRCDGYGYIKVKPMTNEEYIKSCTTKQLADVLFKIWENGYNSTIDIHTPFSFLFGENWLKEEHK